MNILFVNYGDFTTNSLNHIGSFANELTARGHTCVVAVPEKPETLSSVHQPLFVPATFAELLSGRGGFPDGHPADLVHAWTPRENVRAFVVAYLAAHPAPLFIHLEDNERHLAESFAKAPLAELQELDDEALAEKLPANLIHPVRHRSLLRLATGVTVITDRLRELVPGGVPIHRLLPGVDAQIYAPQPADPARRAELGVGADEHLLVFTGSLTFANLADVRALHVAVRLLNDRGLRTRLVRTGHYHPELLRRMGIDLGDRTIDLGFIAKEELGPLLALADVLVQPGAPDDFNDFRLPSKIPEFLWSGRPVVLPHANLAREMQPGYHALFLESSTPDEIAARCQEIFRNGELAARLATGAHEFAREHFDLPRNTAGLLEFYALARRARPEPVGGAAFDDDLALAAQVATRAEGREPIAGDAGADLVSRVRALTACARRLAESRAAHAALTQQAAAGRAKHEHELRLAAERERYLETALADLRNSVEVLRRQAGLANENEAHVRAELAAARAREAALHAAAEQREDKLRRVTRSASWTMTAPFRAARRKLLDPFRKTDAAPAPTLPAADSVFAASLDDPADLARLPARGVVRGWCFARDGAPVVGVRVSLGGKTFDGEYRLARPDVAAGHPAAAGAAKSGFIAEYEIAAGPRRPLVVEALDAEGRWRVAHGVWAEVPAGDAPRDYAEWVRKYDTPTLAQTVTLRARLEAAAHRPLISVLMPVYNAPEQWLVRAIESVRAQVYPHWELCIADDASTAPHVQRVLEDFRRRDERIKVEYRAANGHISAASNSALALARGEFCALLDHDDELAPHALAEVVLAHNRAPEADYFYSDEDKLDEAGRRFDPYFKPDWNPDLLLGQNYTCHLSVFRTQRLRGLGFREGFEGSQDWDVALRFTEDLTHPQIVHIPRVLYHWRAIAGSTALVIDQKNYPAQAARRALEETLARRSLRGELLPVEGQHWRVRRALPEAPPRVSIVIPTRNGADLLRRAIGSIRTRTAYPNYELIVVNHASDAEDALGYFAELRDLGAKVIDADGEFNFSRLNNLAVPHATGEVLLFLNNDVETIHEEWLGELVAHALRPEVGCVGALLHYPDNTIQHAGIVLGVGGGGPNGAGGVGGHAFKRFPRGHEGQRNRLRLVQNYSAVTAACLAIRRAVFAEVGGFNEADLPVAFNDVDFCLRVRRAGYWNVWTPFAELYHHESASRGAEDTPEKAARFRREVEHMRRAWGPVLDTDPAYNRNLTFVSEDFALAWPPR